MCKVTCSLIINFGFDSVIEASGHVSVVVLPLVKSIKDHVYKLANLGILVASLYQ